MVEWRRTLDTRCSEADLAPSVRDEIEREVAEHFQDRFDDLTTAGATADEATSTVVAEMPDVAALRRLARSRTPPRAAAPPAPGIEESSARFHHLSRDLAYAWRTWRTDRTFATATVATLALCLAANIAVFAVVNTVLLGAIDAPDPEALVQLGNVYPGAGLAAATIGNSSVPDYADRKSAVSALAEHALLSVHGVSVGQEPPERLTAMTATPSLFPLLQAHAALGRTLLDDDGEVGRDNIVVLSDGYWRRRFGASPTAVGQTILIAGLAHEVVGVMPPGFRFFDDGVQVWLPAAFTAEERSDESRHNNSWTYVARLAAGASLDQAQSQVDALNAANLERFPALKQVLLDAQFRTVVRPLLETLTADVRRPLVLLWGGIVAVLVIGVVNLMALAMARATGRRGEFAMRLALGASRERLRTQFVTEHVALAAIGGLLGAALAHGLLWVLPRVGSGLVPDGRTLTFDSRVWAYAVALTVTIGLGLGLTAVRAVGAVGAAAALRDDGRSKTGSRAARRFRQGLVVAQVAMACVLLVGAGVLLTSFRRLMAVDPGFRPAVVTGSLSLPRADYATDDARRAFHDRLLARVRALPGVSAAGLTNIIPFGPDRSDSVVWPEDRPATPGQSIVSPDQVRVSEGYFEAMGIRLVNGRTFTARDQSTSEPVIVVDERLAARFWPGRNPLDRYVIQPLSQAAFTNPTPETIRRHRVVGVVANVSQHDIITPASHIGTYYFAAAQEVPSAMVLAVTSTAVSDSVVADLRLVLRELDPRLPLFDVKTMRERIDLSVGPRRLMASLALAFGGLALVLSTVGLYGVLAYLVTQRRREIGIRMALGGSTPAIASLVVLESVTVVGVGIALGLGGAIWLGRVLAHQLPDVGGLDGAAIAAAVGLLLIAALAATLAPARQALSVDPAATLAAE